MKKTIFLIIGLIFIASPAMAQVGGGTNVPNSAAKQNIGQGIQAQKENALKLFQEQRKAAVKEMQEKKEQFQQEVQNRQEAIKTKIQQNKEQLREGLKKIKNEYKQQAVERVNNRFQDLNKIWTDHFVDVLNRLDQILDNIASRADKAEANGQDVSSVRTAISQAKDAISEARTAVVAQAGKVYTITITTEESLRQDVKNTREQIFIDLKNFRDKVKDARDAVHDAATTLAKIPNVNSYEIKNNSTSSVGNTTTTNQ